MTPETKIEDFRDRLQMQLRDDYFDKIENKDDPSAERYALIATASTALKRIIEIESQFLTEMLAETDEGICPSCLIKDATDVANIKNATAAFNHYLTTANSMHH